MSAYSSISDTRGAGQANSQLQASDITPVLKAEAYHQSGITGAIGTYLRKKSLNSGIRIRQCFCGNQPFDTDGEDDLSAYEVRERPPVSAREGKLHAGISAGDRYSLPCRLLMAYF